LSELKGCLLYQPLLIKFVFWLKGFPTIIK
jgi:hypothetical protein